jgi:hypothetical protein
VAAESGASGNYLPAGDLENPLGLVFADPGGWAEGIHGRISEIRNRPSISGTGMKWIDGAN